MNFNQRILITVFPLDSFVRCNRGARQERKTVVEVLENNRPIVGWVQIFLHIRYILSVFPLNVKVALRRF